MVVKSWFLRVPLPMQTFSLNKTFQSLNKAKPTIIVLSALLLLWALLAWLVADPITLPSPWRVWQGIVKIALNGALWTNTSITFLRVLASVILSMGIGVVLGMIMGYYEKANAYLEPVIVIFLNMPALIVAIMAYLYIGFNEISLIVAVSFNKIPMVAVTIREGVRARNPDIDAVAHLYHMRRGPYLWAVLWPQLLPFVSTSVRNGLALIWKIILVFEFLGRPSGVGFEIHKNFQLFKVDMILAYSFAFIALMMVIEWCIVAPWDRKMQKWRKTYAYSY